MEIEQVLKEAIKKSINKKFALDIADELVMVEIPRDSSWGDYSTNAAMRLTKILHQNPRVIADALAEELKTQLPEAELITVANPGFINFKMRKTTLANIINKILEQKDDYGRNNIGNGEKVLVEYVSANPTGDLHLGHARGAAWGDSVTRLMNFSGYDCLREYYINDAGHQIEMLGESLISRYFSCFGKEYPLPEDGYHGPDVIGIAKQIAQEDGDKWLTADQTERLKYFKERGTDLELEKIKRDLAYYRVSFDSWIHEKFFYENDGKRIKDVLDTMKNMNLTYEQDGALWFKSTQYGDDKDRVLRKKDGSLTYLTPDIANHVYKLQRGYTKLVNFWGADHHGYVKRMTYALEAMGYPKGTLEVDLIQMVRLVENGMEVKMSKRTGNAITIRELCDDIGVDAARYFFVCKDVATHFDFDLGLARKQTSDNPVFYVQYAYARMHSIIESCPEFKKIESYDLLKEEKETLLLKHINEFPSVVADAAKTRMPNKICNYVQKLAQYFHSYYGSYKVNNKDDLELTNQRVGLVLATMVTLKNALNLIGIEAKDKM